MKYIFYIVAHNERWDDIAYRYYGDCYNIKPIVEANPHLKIEGILPEGVEIIVPIDEKSVKNDDSRLPVWKRTAVGVEGLPAPQMAGKDARP